MLRAGNQGQDECMKVKGHRPEGSHFPFFLAQSGEPNFNPILIPYEKEQRGKEGLWAAIK